MVFGNYRVNAPIAIFAFRRPDHLMLTIEKLKANELASDSYLYIFSDGPRSKDDVDKVEAVRSLARRVDGFAGVTLHCRDSNIGLAQSIITGVSMILAVAGRVIVVEDDLITAPYFLRYMNDGLNRYAEAERVASVHGYMYPVDECLPETFFLRGADCWGWATWSRAWAKFEPDPHKLLNRLKERNLAHRFDLDGSFGFTTMLQDFANGKNNSWAIRWHASAFLEDMLTLYPKQSLVHNFGFDNSGTHCNVSDFYDVALCARSISVDLIPIDEYQPARTSLARFFSASSKPSNEDALSPPALIEPASAIISAPSDPTSARFYSLNNLDRQLRSFISKRNGFFVELGANDGVNQSNTLHFERELGWRGVLIEPIPHRYLDCLKNRAADNKIFCNACVSSSYEKEFVKIIYSNLMSISPDLNGDIADVEEHAKKGLQFLPEGEVNFAFGAIARTLTSLLKEADAPLSIDLLSLDVEGSELDVLNGLDFENFSFEYMLIESRDFNRIDIYLKQKGYIYLRSLSEHDYLFTRIG